jgi:hypothetical protein
MVVVFIAMIASYRGAAAIRWRSLSRAGKFAQRSLSKSRFGVSRKRHYTMISK